MARVLSKNASQVETHFGLPVCQYWTGKNYLCKMQKITERSIFRPSGKRRYCVFQQSWDKMYPKRLMTAACAAVMCVYTHMITTDNFCER